MHPPRSLYVRTEHRRRQRHTTNAVAVKFAAASRAFLRLAAKNRGLADAFTQPDSAGKASPVTSENPAQSGRNVYLWAAGLGAVKADDVRRLVGGCALCLAPDAPVLTPVDARSGWPTRRRSFQRLCRTAPSASTKFGFVAVAICPRMRKLQLLIISKRIAQQHCHYSH